nr:ankyrin repeat domain-containing protein [Saccharothrix sp. NRRL B-16348]
MPHLPARPDLDQLRHQARDLMRAARRGDSPALARVRAVSDQVVLASAQLAIAREHGFPSRPKLKLEVERRDVLNQRDPSRLADLPARHPESATTKMAGWSDHRRGADVLGYLAMLRFDHRRLGLPRDVPGAAAAAKALIDAGAPVDGHPGDRETPLITAASYGDAEVAKVLIDAGADLDAASAPDSGGVPGGTAVEHAAVFGMTDVLDLLVAAGARVDSPEMAAAAGDLSAWPPAGLSPQCRLRSLCSRPTTNGWTSSTCSSPPAPRWTKPTPSGSGCRCTSPRPTASPPVSAGCWSTAPTRPCATPSTSARRWSGAGSRTTAQGTKKSKPSS